MRAIMPALLDAASSRPRQAILTLLSAQKVKKKTASEHACPFDNILEDRFDCR